MPIRDHWRAWRLERYQKKLARLTAPSGAPNHQISPETAREVSVLTGRDAHKFAASVSWDDIEQRYTMLGPMTPIYSTGYVDNDLDRLLRASAWSWAAINANAKAIAQLTPLVQEKIDGRWQAADQGHAAYDFLADPLGTDDRLPYWSWSHLMYVIALHYYSVGNSYLVPVESLAGLSVLPLLQPMSMSVDDADLDVHGVPTRYTYRRMGQPDKYYRRGELLNIMAPSPSSFWKGAAPLQAALRSTEIDHVATDRQRYNLRNRIAPGPIISHEYIGPTPEQIEQTKQALIDDYRDAQNDGDPLVLGGGAKVTKGWSADELQVFQTKNSAREEIIATIGVQPSIMGQLDSATYSNTKEATVLWFTDSIAPVLEIIYGQWTSQLIGRRWPNVRLSYSLAGSQIGMQVMSAKLDVADKLQKLGYTTNDINAELEIGMPYRDYLEKSTGADVIAGRAPADEDPVDEVDDEDLAEDDQAPDLAVVGD